MYPLWRLYFRVQAKGACQKVAAPLSPGNLVSKKFLQWVDKK
jgi:hypothetical protein